MSKKIKRLFTKSTIFLLSILFSLSASEILIRAFSPKPSKRLGHNQLFVEYDPLLGWRKIPNKKGKHVKYEYEISESMNSKGIRGPEYSYDKIYNEYRILILGDSFAEGYTVEFNELFSEVLKRELNNKGDKYHEVINTGTAGYSTDQEFLFFQNEGKKYAPDLTILMFYQNDVWYNNRNKYWRGYKPLFKLEDGELRLTNVPVLKLETQSNQTHYITTKNTQHMKIRNTMAVFPRIKKWLYEKSYLCNFITDRIRNTYYLHALVIKLGLTEKNIQKEDDERNNENGIDDKIGLIPDEFRVWAKVYNTEIRDAWKITEAIIIKLKEETTAVGSKLLVFYNPDQASIYDEEWQATKRKYGISDKSWSIDLVGIELEAVCKRNNIDFINPTATFRAEANKIKIEGGRLYFIKDGHWNVNGHKFVGEILTKYFNTNYSMNNK